jgi:hypothetical protein
MIHVVRLSVLQWQEKQRSKHDTCSTRECSSVARKTKDLIMMHIVRLSVLQWQEKQRT